MQIFLEEGRDALARVGGCLGAIALLVVGVLKRMACAVIDLDVRDFSVGLHRGFECFYVFRGNALIVRAEIPLHRRFDFRHKRRLRRQPAIIHHACGQFRLVHGQLEGPASAHAPSDRTNFAGIHVRARGQIGEGRFKVAHPAVIRQAAHQDVRFILVRSHFSAIQIHGQCHVPLLGVLLRLLLHPVIQAPPFMNHDDRRVLARAIRQRQIAAHRFVAALVADRLRFWRSSSQRQSECQNSQRQYRQESFVFHVYILQRKRLRNFSASRSPKPPPVYWQTQLTGFCSSSNEASTPSLCVFTSTVVHTFRTTPFGSSRYVCRAESFATPRFITESYFSDTSVFVSASSLKVRLSFAQNSWCDFSSCMLTPRITAFFASYLARSR